MQSFKCASCGAVTKAIIRPHLCPKCKAGRRMLKTVEEKKEV